MQQTTQQAKLVAGATKAPKQQLQQQQPLPTQQKPKRILKAPQRVI